MSKEQIVGAAIAILDAQGETALTFRTLAARLATGSGAIYWHVDDKRDLMAAAADCVIAAAAALPGIKGSDPFATIRVIALAIFDEMDRRPWLGAQLARNPLQSAALRILEGVGSEIGQLGLSDPVQFNAASAILSFILGLAGQHASAVDLVPTATDRTTFLGLVAARWAGLAPEQYPFVRRIAAQLPNHDDREQFLAGIDLVLAGIESLR